MSSSTWSRCTSQVRRPMAFELEKVGGVHENEIVAIAAPARFGDPAGDVGANELVGRPSPPTPRRASVRSIPPIRLVSNFEGEPVGRKIAGRPVQVRLRQVHRRRLLRTAGRSMQRRHTRIGEQIQEALAGGHLPHHLAGHAVIEEDARIKIAAQIDLADQTVLARVGHETATAGVAVLPAPLRT